VKHKPLGRLIGAFKTVSTKQINKIRLTPDLPLWQRNYYEHVVRNDDELNRIREYILQNPLQWELDPENPNKIDT
jgi:putative transposase